MKTDRRSFVVSAATIASAGLITGAGTAAFSKGKKSEGELGVEEVSPVEDLMREHGGLNRILLIYDTAARRIASGQDLDPSLIQKSATLIQSFIENYHEKLEEEFLFPRLIKANKLVDLVGVLKTQHAAGRRVTSRILKLVAPSRFKNSADRDTLVTDLRQFVVMYRPHEAREDTVVFPTFKTVVTPKEYDELGETFEDREHQLFGKAGFDGVVAQIAEIEKALDIYELERFTPKGV